jgi:hypothetical protein
METCPHPYSRFLKKNKKYPYTGCLENGKKRWADIYWKFGKVFLSRRFTDWDLQTSGGRSYTPPKILELYGDLPPSISEILKKKTGRLIHWLSRKLRFSKPQFKQAFWTFLQTYLRGELLHPSKNSGTLWRLAPINIRDFKKKNLKIHAGVV